MSSEPTLPASPTKRLLAKREGNVTRSRHLVPAAILLGSTILLQWQFKPIEQHLNQNWERQLTLHVPLEETAAQWSTISFWLLQAIPILQLFAPIILGVITIAVLSNLLQTGLIFAPRRVAPDSARLNPLAWWKRMTLPEHQAETIGSLLRSVGLFAITTVSLWGQREEIAALSLLPTAQIITSAVSILSQILLQLGSALFVLGILDYVWQKLKWERSLRMTPEELRQEQKSQRSNAFRSKPTVAKANQDSHDLAQASVVLYIPGGPIVAITYDEENMDVPRIQQIWQPNPKSAKNSDGVIQLAQAQGVRCQMHQPLTTLIANTLRPRQLIPPYLYREVINILRQV
ncbi:MAG: EscU/YscU/HrcU family type III secretion system export apparatus switch protein [Planctomycetota bacterium]|nr:EscU/YscU/HrcU family type III secretion system export apparatus switch protein [Planctomycetota bacterium]